MRIENMNKTRSRLIEAAKAVCGDLQLRDEFSAGGVGAAILTARPCRHSFSDGCSTFLTYWLGFESIRVSIGHRRGISVLIAGRRDGGECWRRATCGCRSLQ